MEGKHAKHNNPEKDSSHESNQSPLTGKDKWVYVSYILVAIVAVSLVSNFFLLSKLTGYMGPPKVNVAEGAGSIGKVDAPLSLVMYTDFQCPYCAMWFTQTWPSIKENFVDTGLMKFEVKHFPLSFHNNAKIAANAAECAEEQGSFLEYEALLYANQNALDRASLIRYASQASLDEAKFTACLDESRYQEKIDAEFSEGSSSGISGTPGFILNGQSLPLGASAYSAFEAEFNRALGK